MRDELVSRELALSLKEMGFDWECNHYFRILEGLGLRGASLQTSSQYINWNDDKSKANGDEFVSIPTQSLAHRWFREAHGISIEAWYSSVDRAWLCDEWVINPIKEIYPSDATYPTYEEALEAGLKVSTEYLKEVGMKINEFRIGNYVKYNGTWASVRSIIAPFPGHEEPNIELECNGIIDAHPNDIGGIELTHEIVQSFGFQKVMERIFEKGNYMVSDIFGWQFNTAGLNDRPLAKISYLHELQNIYFALTKEELNT